MYPNNKINVQFRKKIFIGQSSVWNVLCSGLEKFEMSKPSLKEILGIGKVQNLWSIVKANGGILKSLYTLYRMDVLKAGKLMGMDKYGNKYYENRSLFIGSSRWVVYNPDVGLQYDATQIPPEWFGWMHYKTDYVPYDDPTRPKYPWMLDHTENLTGTPQQYIGYSTVPPKIHAWVPPKKT